MNFLGNAVLYLSSVLWMNGLPLFSSRATRMANKAWRAANTDAGIGSEYWKIERRGFEARGMGMQRGHVVFC